MPLRVFLLVPCLLLLAPSMARAAQMDIGSLFPVLEDVGVSEHPVHDGRGLKLTFQRLPPAPALARFSLEEARLVVAALEAEFKAAQGRVGSVPRAQRALGGAHTSTLLMPPAPAPPSELEKRLREGYEAIYGPPAIPLPTSVENARWLQALKLSPRYMGEGVREAAVEMFQSPTVLLSVGMSLMLYMTAWAVPEPLFSKALAATVTVWLLLTYSAVELYTVGQACMNLYREAEAARNAEQLEAAAERFGKALGGVGLRVLVTLAGAKVSRNLPEVPQGGLWTQLSPPRFALMGGGTKGGFMVSAGTRAQVSIADGTVVLMGISANMTASAAVSAATAARTAGACRDAANKGDARGHHIATNKNDISSASGGPWTPLFEELFARAGMSLDDPANLIYLMNHQGPHHEQYHREVYRTLEDALKNCRSQRTCREKLIRALDKLAGELCTPGSTLNKLATKKP
jgi:hypothetical protein